MLHRSLHYITAILFPAPDFAILSSCACLCSLPTGARGAAQISESSDSCRLSYSRLVSCIRALCLYNCARALLDAHFWSTAMRVVLERVPDWKASDCRDRSVLFWAFSCYYGAKIVHCRLSFPILIKERTSPLLRMRKWRILVHCWYVCSWKER